MQIKMTWGPQGTYVQGSKWERMPYRDFHWLGLAGWYICRGTWGLSPQWSRENPLLWHFFLNPLLINFFSTFHIYLKLLSITNTNLGTGIVIIFLAGTGMVFISILGTSYSSPILALSYVVSKYITIHAYYTCSTTWKFRLKLASILEQQRDLAADKICNKPKL